MNLGENVYYNSLFDINKETVDEIKKLLITDENYWNNNTYRQKTFKVHEDTESLIISFIKPYDDSATFFDEYLMEKYRELLEPLFDKVADCLGFENKKVNRILFAKLKSGGEIIKHIDSHVMFETCHRIHIPIITDEKCEFYIDDEIYFFPEGGVIDMNNRKMHGVKNKSDMERIHLIFDIEDSTMI